ncbi:MAG: ABC transporter ATP-binding protein [Dermatophilaceae bacterium]
MTEPLLRARDVTHAFGSTRALRGVDLEVDDGEIVAVTGPSGSGKSTLLLCLAGLLVPDDGTVEIAGTDLHRLGPAARTAMRRELVAVVLQYGSLIPELTAAENVMIPQLLGGRRRADAAPLAHRWLERLGVGSVAAVRAEVLSGGQRQLVAVARALVTSPRLVLADEPTGALDSAAADLVMRELVGAAREAGTAVVVVTHDARVAAHADRDIHLWDGQVDGADDVPLSGGADGVVADLG